ncbi:hypothetical protein BGW38_003540 [Lunasporangiospora selenospora]|uniref:Uncharacterized protein n=1 Tax=Lunasporangiospora selenospora TaxID=979761 RepID=A0A9P6KCS6_9FUNG|nr:hypothetical protein BGW38_003540 [Lunasporangiospora selenospora]
MSLQDHYKQRSKVSTPEDEVPKGGSAVTPSEPSQESKQQLPGTESLDAPSKQLLERVCPENSLPPLFWGYIWLYIPNSGTSPFSSNTTSPHEGVLEEPKLPRLPSQGLSRSTSRAGNISIKKATGRYIKCFSVISSEGQLHWVEAANNDEVDRRSESCKGSGSRTSYSLLLDSSAPCKNSASSTARNSQCFPDKSTPSDDYQSVTHNGSDNWPQSEKSIQASMAHKLRLYFFCIKISTSSLPDVRLEKTEVQEEEKSVRPRVDKRSEIKARNRISAPIATRPMTLLQLSSSGSSTPAKTRTLSGTFPSGFLNQPVWPSMSPFNERQPPTSSSTISQERLSQALAKVQMKSNSPRASFIKAATLFAENRIRSAPPGSIIPQRPTPPLRPLPLTRTASISSQRSLNLASKGIQSIASSPSIEPRSRNSLDMRRTGTNSPGPDMFITTINLPSPVPVPRSLASPPLGQRSLPSPTSPTTSNVLNLAEGLRNALMSRQLSLSSSDSNSSIATDDSQSSKNPSTSSVSSPGESDSGWNARKPKMSLSETMAAKRATLTEANAASAAAAILASREQSRYQLVHGRARGTSGAEDYFSYRGGVQHKRSAPLATTMESEHEGPVEGKRGKDEEKYAGAKKTIENIMKMCPFLEKIEGVDGQGRGYVTLKGYTETEEAWKTLQVALEQFIDGPIKDQRFALPPEDTLIPSYHAPRIPEVRLSEKAQNFLLVRDKLTAAAAAASAAAMLRMGTEGQPMTGSTMATNSIPTGSKSPGKSGSTKNAFGRFSRQLGGRDWGGGGHGYSLRQKAQQQQLQRRSMPITKQSLEYLNQNDVTNLFCFGEESNHSQSQNASRIGKQTAA